MKLTKSLFMLCAAGLSLCACNSDDKELFPEGEGRVEVTIVSPQTRATTDSPSELNSIITVTGTYTVTLHAASGVQTKEIADGTKKAVFSNVVSPTKVTVKLNEGKPSYEASEITNLQQEPTSIPVYGETSSFGTGPTSVVDGKNVTTYTANVTMAIPVARLEIGTIAFDNTNNTFTILEAGGVYLDKLRNNGSIYQSGKFVEQATGVQDYQFGTTDQFGKGETAILKDGASVDMLGVGALLPATGKVYAYNFFGATPTTTPLTGDALTNALAKNPQFKIYFSSSKTSSEANSSPRYAMITKYKSSVDSEQGIVLENGKVYRIVDVTLAEKNVILDEENNTVYEVEVVVEEAKWSVAQTYADWAN